MQTDLKYRRAWLITLSKYLTKQDAQDHMMIYRGMHYRTKANL